ncbi:bi-domain-containing oxidoreductase [Avibacterium avium]|uniref:bi-domain-containing oxidoreductase n=1 Tax=Avibacterium avium TaxID=751 RepID=UPI003BF7B21A
MKQILQDMTKGETSIVEAPMPTCTKGHLLISTNTSLISAGTERMLVDFGKASILDKARQQPEKVKMVFEKIQTDGLLTTYDAVKSKLAQPLPLGYCNVGKVYEVGEGVTDFKVGDRVVSNGPHADIVRVPKNLCAKIPDNVTDEAASFTVVASIGLQGIRLAKPTIGECFVVIGAGLIGLLTIQMLLANGCRVLAIDFDSNKLELAKKFGAEICNPAQGEDPISVGLSFSRGIGVDGVIITASTKVSDPVTQAARMSRKRGRIILVGVTGLELNRSDFYEKELSFQVSCSYGPGRYDSTYEEKGQDYPIGFVRWTEQRNFVAILDMMSLGILNVDSLITHRFEFENAPKAYDILTKDRAALGILLKYTSDIENRIEKKIILNPIQIEPQNAIVGFIGAGNYASRILIPAFKKADSKLHTIVTSGGINSVIHGERSGFAEASTDVKHLFDNKDINTVAIATRHNSHAYFVEKALESGKNVFVEKPLALTIDEITKIEQTYSNNVEKNEYTRIMVGFNRRFAPQIQKMKALLGSIKEPKSFIMTMNAGSIPADHWTQDGKIGGGRIIGEACHFIDLMRFLADSKITSIQARRMGENNSVQVLEDKASITLGFEDGSFGTIFYLANGALNFPKERIEVFTAGKVLQLDNFRKLKGFGWDKFKKMNLWRQDKGQNACVAAFIDSIRQGKESPIPAEQIFEVAKVTIQVADILRAQK